MHTTKITGTGSYIPQITKTNRDFTCNDFYLHNQEKIDKDPLEVIEKFQQITGIEERRYANEDMNASCIGAIAAKAAIAESGIDPESIDQIIVAHNFGDVNKHSNQTDAMPSLASRVKHELGIKNPKCIPYDILFGCPGWVQGVIQADTYIKAGVAKKCLVIGTETLSRVLDPYDRDSMIFSDGAGACIVEKVEQDGSGILSHSTLAHCEEEVDYLYMGKSNFPESDPRVRYIKMLGRKVYEYAITHVPAAMKHCLDEAGVGIEEVKKVFIHQANEKLDEGIIKRFYRLFGQRDLPEGIMPMSIHKLGNSSVATVPTLLDLVRKGEMEGHQLSKGDVIILASVGAGMNINAVCYKV
ncbi:3-oxoacyl-ACP synthase III family protein [Fulvivirga lutea]|uniref:Ketoacyl-ACP synthase III n=1 Tax=Fulvivirga lutea TaxID=2810512 RepID=A0A974WKG4_9BACT|nr:ketoacyl-ACP synthase III [Fulvivirga lutea]QSE98872.1 ketoacyl-ACP synthase III [Fulvivirga lutea]